MTQSNETVADKTLEITRVFDAPRELVFQAWTDSKHMAQWCAPAGFSIPLSEGEAHSGGTWRTTMVAPDGAEYSCNGEYREVVPPEKLVFSHAWDEADMPRHETLVTVTFSDIDANKTRMDFRQEFFRSKSSRDGHEGGWTEAFERLTDYLDAVQKKQGGC